MDDSADQVPIAFKQLVTSVQEANRKKRALPDLKSSKVSPYQLTLINAILNGALESLGSTERTRHGTPALEAARVLEAFADMIRERPNMLGEIIAGKTRVKATPAE